MMYIQVTLGDRKMANCFNTSLAICSGAEKIGSKQVGQSFEAWTPSDDIGLVVSVSQNTELENAFSPSLHHETAGEDDKQFEHIFYHHLEPP